MKTMMKQKMYKQLCIPRVESKWSIEYISKKIMEFQLGEIVSIKEIPLKNDIHYKRILFTMVWDKTKEKTFEAEELMKKCGSLKFVFNMPWYWKVVDSKFQSQPNRMITF